MNVAVQSEDLMYNALLTLRDSDNLVHAPLQNALRRYWKYKKGYEFSTLKQYESMQKNVGMGN